MTTNITGQFIEVGGTPIEVVRKDIKNLHVGVYPPNGRVRVAVPLRLDDEALRMAIISRLGWIKQKQSEFERQDRQSQREFVTGESHYFEGRRYLLDVVEDERPPMVCLLNKRTMALRIQSGTSRDSREEILYRWYRHQLRSRLPELVKKWESRVGKQVSEVRIKKMKTRWGTCNSDSSRIWLNLELIKKPPSCLEYIVVHEMAHLVEGSHNSRFHHLMDSLMPQWSVCRDQLNQSPLAHADWRY